MTKYVFMQGVKNCTGVKDLLITGRISYSIFLLLLKRLFQLKSAGKI